MDALILSDFTSASNSQSPKASTAKERKIIGLSSSIKLLLVFAVGFAAWTSWKPSLYDQYKIDTAIIASQLSQVSNIEFKRAATYLENGDYDEARQIVSKYYLRDLSNINLAKQYAIILIASDCFDTSKEVLYPVFDSKNVKHKSEAAYLLGLTFLKEGRYLISQQWLAKVSSSSVYYRQAKELILKIEGLKTAKESI